MTEMKPTDEIGYVTERDDVNLFPLVITVQEGDPAYHPMMRVFVAGTAEYLGAVLIPSKEPKSVFDIRCVGNKTLSLEARKQVLDILRTKESLEGLERWKLAQLFWEVYHGQSFKNVQE